MPRRRQPSDDARRRHASSSAPGERRRIAMSVSRPFIERPIATSLLGARDDPRRHPRLLWRCRSRRCRRSISRPSKSRPSFRARAPRRCRRSSRRRSSASSARSNRLASMSSTSSFGLSRITLQFNLDRDIDAAAQDVQAAINAAGSTLAAQPPLSADLLEGQSSRHADHDAGADVRHPVAALALRSCRHAARPAPEFDLGRRPRLDRRRHQAGRAHRGRCVAPCELRPQHGRSQRRRSAPPTSPGPRARSTATSSPSPSPPTIRSARRRPTRTSSSPIATARRCA